MNSRGFIVCVLTAAIVLCSASVFSADDRVVALSLDEAVRRALATSESLQIENSRLRRREGEYRQARSVILPRVNGDIAVTRNGAYPDSARLQKHELDAGIGVTQLLWSFGAVSSAIRAAAETIEAGRYGVETERLDVSYEAKVAYYAALLADETEGITRESYANAQENQRLLESAVPGVRRSRRDLIKMRADVASRLPLVSDARAQKESAFNTLRTYTGIEPEKDITLNESFDGEYQPVDAAGLEKILLSENPQLKSLDRSTAAAENIVRIRKAAYLPTVSAFASWYHRGGNEDDYLTEFGVLDEYGAAGIVVDVPIWNGGATAAGVEQAEADRDASRYAREQALESAILALHNAVSRYNGFRETLTANREAVTLATESFELTRDMFESGMVTLTELNDAELLLTSERLKLAATLYQINVVRAEIERLTGGKL